MNILLDKNVLLYDHDNYALIYNKWAKSSHLISLLLAIGSC